MVPQSPTQGARRLIAWAALSLVLSAPAWAGPPPSPTPATDLPGLCADLRAAVKKFGWAVEPCDGLDWKVGGHSVLGRPIIYVEFGPANATNVTLVLTMVHGDEVTPLYLGLELARWLKSDQYKNPSTRVILAPLVNPDGFFRHARTNHRRVDVNRNFPTLDWEARALNAWKVKFRSDPRRFPGKVPGSEPETQFQRDLINQYKPQKILSVHAPLNYLDYDGPSVVSLDRFPTDYVRECTRLTKQLKAKSTGFFPGSLGNYAGQEMGIPTITMELPTANPKLARKYWEQFRPGIATMIDFRIAE